MSVKNYTILNQVVAEKTLLMCYIGVTVGKIENLKKIKQNKN